MGGVLKGKNVERSSTFYVYVNGSQIVSILFTYVKPLKLETFRISVYGKRQK